MANNRGTFKIPSMWYPIYLNFAAISQINAFAKRRAIDAKIFVSLLFKSYCVSYLDA